MTKKITGVFLVLLCLVTAITTGCAKSGGTGTSTKEETKISKEETKTVKDTKENNKADNSSKEAKTVKGAEKTGEKDEDIKELTGNDQLGETMKTVTGKSIKIDPENSDDIDQYLTYNELGLGVYLPDSWKDVKMDFPGKDGKTVESSPFSASVSDLGIEFMYTSESILDLKEEDIPEDEDKLIDLYSQYMLPCFITVKVSDGDDEQEILDLLKEQYSKIETVGKWKGNTYYFAYNDKFDEKKYPKLTETDRKNLDVFIKSINEIKDNIYVFPPEETKKVSSAGQDTVFSSFSEKDLNGNEVTDQYIKDHDLTMINIWATWCGPCVGEIPDIAKLYDKLPKNVGLLTICEDMKDSPDDVKDILEKSGAKFTVLGHEGELGKLIDSTDAFPTTIFVNSEGKQVGEIIEGSQSEEAYMEEIENRLKQ